LKVTFPGKKKASTKTLNYITILCFYCYYCHTFSLQPKIYKNKFLRDSTFSKCRIYRLNASIFQGIHYAILQKCESMYYTLRTKN
jgi:hypothetical protein